MPGQPAPSTAPVAADYLLIHRMRSVARNTPPFDTNLLVQLRDGRLIAARISSRSPDDPHDAPGFVARMVQRGRTEFPAARFVMYAGAFSPGEHSPTRALPYHSDQITHWSELDTNERRTLQ